MANENKMKQIRTYMSYSYPVDPVRIVSIPDMDLSYALASTLVQWDKDKQISSGLAISWKANSEKSFLFKLRNDSKWSNGERLTAQDVKNSLERAFKKYPHDLRSLMNEIKDIQVISEDSVQFNLTEPTSESGLLGKLTEPNYGVLKTKKNDEIDLTVSSGPFYVSKASVDEIILKKNANWFHSNNEMALEVIIRKPLKGSDFQKILLEDSWPNLIETSSLISSEILTKYKANNYTVWTRPLDKVFNFQLSNKFVKENGASLLKYLFSNLDKSILTEGLYGISITNQTFPIGYTLHEKNFNSKEITPFPAIFKNKTIKVLISPARVSGKLKANLEKSLTTAGVKFEFLTTDLEKLGERKKIGDYDLYVGVMGLADPDPEGVMSYYFEGATPVIQSGNENFIKKLDDARNEKTNEVKIQKMRSLMTEAISKGHFLPLFHLSSVGIGKAELDFSNIPVSDESVTLSKVKFKD